MWVWVTQTSVNLAYLYCSVHWWSHKTWASIKCSSSSMDNNSLRCIQLLHHSNVSLSHPNQSPIPLSIQPPCTCTAACTDGVTRPAYPSNAQAQAWTTTACAVYSFFTIPMWVWVTQTSHQNQCQFSLLALFTAMCTDGVARPAHPSNVSSSSMGNNSLRCTQLLHNSKVGPSHPNHVIQTSVNLAYLHLHCCVHWWSLQGCSLIKCESSGMGLTLPTTACTAYSFFTISMSVWAILLTS